jgi:hypothetical protein
MTLEHVAQVVACLWLGWLLRRLVRPFEDD